MKTYKIFWTHYTVQDLTDIIGYIKRERPQTAGKWYRAIRARCLQLKHNPTRYRVVPELSAIGINFYREIIITPYRILFQLEKTSVFVFAIFDGRRDIETLLLHRMTRE